MQPPPTRRVTRSRSLYQERDFGASFLRRIECTIGRLLPSAGNDVLVACTVDGDVIFFDCRNDWQELARLMHPTDVVSMCWATLKNQAALACLCADGDVRLWRVDKHHIPYAGSRATVVRTGFAKLIEGTITYEGEQRFLAVSGAGNVKVWALKRERTF
ncbi:hypothetical protein OH77DRAFT_1172345 [Trametes cingulata]|nr:hypothetical protein OH77DRAFT_1172345 [Trametes cingulata]